MRLSEVPVGSGAIVRRVAAGTAGEGRRLQEVGFVPGTKVVVERRAPLGDPTVYEVRSTRFALRRAGAELIEVEPSASTFDAHDTVPEATKHDPAQADGSSTPRSDTSEQRSRRR